MMGGDIVVTSEEGVGSTFTISVPRECPEYTEDEVDTNVINLDDQDNLVVLVDDDVAMHDLIKRTISKLNLDFIRSYKQRKRSLIFFTANGFTPEQTCGFIGNFSIEI